MKKIISFLRFLVVRLLCFLEIGLKFCLFLPILLFMVWFNYKVDISGLFQGELAPRQVANLLLEGKNVSDYDKMDERQVLQLYAQNLDKAPDTVALGSSRVLQLTEGLVGGSYFNAGISGAGAMDIMNIWYLFEREDKLPENLILCVDPWLFNPDPDLNKNADTELFAEFLEKGLGIAADYEEPDTVALWKALVDPAYFQGNVTYYLKQKESGVVQTEDGGSIPFHALANGSLGTLEYAAKRADGSVQYPLGFCTWNYDQVMAEVLAQAGTLNAMHGFEQMDAYWTDLFVRFVEHVQQKGVNVVFLLTPYHPFIALHVYNNPQGFTGFFEVEPWVREFAAGHGIPVYGSYHAGRVGIQESMFFDGVHCKPEALRLMFPGIDEALAGGQTAYETMYLATYGGTENSANALIGYDANCVVVDADWLAQAEAATPGP